METNSTTQSDTQVDDKPVTEDDIRDLKYGETGVEPEKADEPEQPEETAEEPEETVSEQDAEEVSPETTFTKKFPHIKGDTPEEYAKNLEAAYDNSTAEYQKLRQQAPEATQEEAEATLPNNMLELYAKQKMDKEIADAWTDFSKEYPQTADTTEYDKFVRRVSTISKSIMIDENRLAEPSELYSTAAASLGWSRQSEPSASEKVGMALKDNASVSRTTSATKPRSRSKVTDEMLVLNRKLYPGKSDAEIREELEPYVQP